MSEDKTQHDQQQELDFEEAKELTVGEAVRKDAELKAGVTDSDSILDKYIKQHREEVASQKFDRQVEADGDTSPLDDFIRKQRQELVDSGLIDASMATEATISTAPQTPIASEASQSEPETVEVPVSPTPQVSTPETTTTPITFDIHTPEAVSDNVIPDTTVPPMAHTATPEDTEVSEQPGDTVISSETVITSANAERFVTSEVEQLDLGETLIAPAISEAIPDAASPLIDDIDLSVTRDLSETVATVSDLTADASSASLPLNEEAVEERISTERRAQETTPFYQRKGVIIGGLVVIALGIGVGGYAIYHNSRQATTTQTTSSSSSSSSKDTAKADNEAFEAAYNNFFTDDAKTTLANDQFDKLPDLEKLLKKLEKTSYYDAAKAKYDSLAKQIKAVQAVNGQFESDALVDGNYNSSIAVKADANFDNLSSDVTSTGNATLDRAIQDAITGGKAQLEAKASSSSAAASATTSSANTNAGSASAPAADNSVSATTGGQSSASASASTGAASTITTRGITNYNPSILQRDKSRVSYNASAVADTTNPAWTWGDGVLDKIIETSHSRGYFSGDNFILEPVNIINGNGYYNLYLPDGTYLFSINCKTGYFVGNGAGHSDNLDF